MIDRELLKRLKAENAALKRRVARVRSALVDMLDVAWVNDDDKLSRTNQAIRKAKRALRDAAKRD